MRKVAFLWRGQLWTGRALVHDVLRIRRSGREDEFGVRGMDGVWLNPFLGIRRHVKISRIFFVIVGGDVIAVPFDTVRRKSSSHFRMLGGGVCVRLGWALLFGRRFEGFGSLRRLSCALKIFVVQLADVRFPHGLWYAIDAQLDPRT